jgi:ankyrin repeat protein
VHKPGVIGKTSLGSGFATKTAAAEAVASYLRGDRPRSVQRAKAEDSPPAFSSSAYSAVMMELMSLKMAHKQLVEEKAAVEEALQMTRQQVKVLRNQLTMRRFQNFPDDVLAHIVTFLAVSETVRLDTACCSQTSRELLNSALMNVSIPAFDDFCFRSTTALEWVLQKKIHLDSLNCNLGKLQPGQNSLSYVISQENYAVAKMIMLSGSEDVNSLIEYLSPSGCLKWAPIHRFASLNDTKALKFLLTETNCNVQTTDSRGWTALHWACLRESYGAAQVLLQHGSDLEAVTDHPSRTPLLISCQRGDVLTARALIEAGAKLDAVDESKNSAILICVQFKAFECCKLLLENGAPANIKCSSGWTALRLALTFEDDRLAELLLQSNNSLL